MYNQQGQNWSQPPWRPDALARAAYKPCRDMLRTVLRHAGAIRIDHVIGLFHQRRNSPITWSMRMAPACRRTVRSMSRYGR